MSPFVFVVLALAAFRLFRLLAVDTITQPLRDRLFTVQNVAMRQGKRLRRSQALAEMWTCPWCLGFWCALVVYVAWLLAPVATFAVALPLALSTVVGFLGKLDDV